MKSNAFVNGYLEGYINKQAVMQMPKNIVGDPGAAISQGDVANAQAFRKQEDAKKKALAVIKPKSIVEQAGANRTNLTQELFK